MFEDSLGALEKRHLLRSIKDREDDGRIDGARITVGGRSVLNFSSNDYLGLSVHPEVTRAAADAALSYGAGAGASRLLSGGCALHSRLEEAAASLKGTEAALLFSSGYSANTGIIPAIASDGDALFSDEMNHASIVDGARLSRASVHVYRHGDVAHLEGLLKKSGARRKVIATDTVFSMQGDIAPLKEICALAEELGALLYLDDAHGTGVLGGGRGALHHFGVPPEPWIIQMSTCSKALGSLGAFAAGSEVVVRWLVNSARSFIYSTALPPPVVAATIKAIEILESDQGLAGRLWQNREMLVGLLRGLGVETGDTATPIIPVMVDSAEDALSLSTRLFEKGIYAPAIRPPTAPSPLIRLTATALHTEEDIGRLAEALKAVISEQPHNSSWSCHGTPYSTPPP